MKEIGKTILSQDKESNYIKTRHNMKEDLSRINLMEKVFSKHLMEMFTKVRLKKVFAKEPDK